MPGFGFGVLKGARIVLETHTLLAGTLQCVAYIRYVSGRTEYITFQSSAPGSSTLVPFYTASDQSADEDGEIVALSVTNTNVNYERHGIHAQVFAWLGASSGSGTGLGGFPIAKLASGQVYNGHSLALGEFQEPDDYTWVFQGTVAEDATAGTHVCTLTVTPGAGNEFEVLYGFIVGGATATAQVYSVMFDDGTNAITAPQNAFSSTTSGATIGIGFATGSNLSATVDLPKKAIVSGTMRFVLKVSTLAVSVTQTFSVACRIKGPRPNLPTATLADMVGTPILTTNTNAVF